MYLKDLKVTNKVKIKKLNRLHLRYKSTYYKRLKIEEKIMIIKYKINMISIRKKKKHTISYRILNNLYTEKLVKLEVKESILLNKELKLFNEFELIKKEVKQYKRIYINQGG